MIRRVLDTDPTVNQRFVTCDGWCRGDRVMHPDEAMTTLVPRTVTLHFCGRCDWRRRNGDTPPRR